MNKSIGFFRMADARCFTDYRQSHQTDNEVKNLLCNNQNKCCKKNDQYNFKLCLINNTDAIRKKLVKVRN